MTANVLSGFAAGCAVFAVVHVWREEPVMSLAITAIGLLALALRPEAA